MWCRLRVLREYLEDDDGVGRNVVDQSPRTVAVVNPKLVALRPDSRHRPGMGEAQHLTLLKSAQQAASMRAVALNGGVLTSPRSQTSRLSEGLIHVQGMSNMTYDPTTRQPRRPSLWARHCDADCDVTAVPFAVEHSPTFLVLLSPAGLVHGDREFGAFEHGPCAGAAGYFPGETPDRRAR